MHFVNIVLRKKSKFAVTFTGFLFLKKIVLLDFSFYFKAILQKITNYQLSCVHGNRLVMFRITFSETKFINYSLKKNPHKITPFIKVNRK